MAIQKPPAISGVSPGREVVIMEVYPSIACTGFGRLIGQALDCLPTPVMGIKLSNLLFGLPAAPLAAAGYLQLKVTGIKYQLTNRGVRKHAALGDRVLSQVPLASIEQVVIEEQAGQQFYRAADLHLLGKGGEELMVLEGVPYAAVFRQTILEARNAHKQTAASLATIEARQPA